MDHITNLYDKLKFKELILNQARIINFEIDELLVEIVEPYLQEIRAAIWRPMCHVNVNPIILYLPTISKINKKASSELKIKDKMLELNFFWEPFNENDAEFSDFTEAENIFIEQIARKIEENINITTKIVLEKKTSKMALN